MKQLKTSTASISLQVPSFLVSLLALAGDGRAGLQGDLPPLSPFLTGLVQGRSALRALERLVPAAPPGRAQLRQTRSCSAPLQTETGTSAMLSKRKQRLWKPVGAEDYRKPKLSCFKWIWVGLNLVLMWVHCFSYAVWHWDFPALWQTFLLYISVMLLVDRSYQNNYL